MAVEFMTRAELPCRPMPAHTDNFLRNDLEKKMSEEINIIGHFNVTKEFGGYLSQHRDSKADRSEPLMTVTQHRSIYDALRAENVELVAALEAALEETSYEDTGYQIATIIQAALAKHRGE